MPAKILTPMGQINDYIDQKVASIREQQLEVLDTAGELAVKDQTLLHKYLNQTGNLSSSVGYVVLDEGRVYGGGGFKLTRKSNGEEGGEEGIRQGEEFINSLIASNQKGLVLIVVAGMDYAIYVENMGKDVLSTAELTAAKMVKELLKEL